MLLPEQVCYTKFFLDARVGRGKIFLQLNIISPESVLCHRSRCDGREHEQIAKCPVDGDLEGEGLSEILVLVFHLSDCRFF
jgi:hypothetical protein